MASLKLIIFGSPARDFWVEVKFSTSFRKSKPVAVSRISEGKLDFTNPGFVSIDCGVTESYKDKKNDLYYESDEKFIETGVNGKILDDYYDKVDVRGVTLRSFPNGTRNCYKLNPKDGKNNKYLVRASFAYGNYDGRNQTPTFDLHLGVNPWTTVELDHSSSYIYKEITYLSLTDYIDVCLVNTGNGVPFISQLELRILESSMYQIDPSGSSSIVTYRRLDIGRSETSGPVWHKDDIYSRIWWTLDAEVFSRWLPFNTTEYIKTNEDESIDNKVPQVVLETAARTENASQPLSFRCARDRESNSDSQYHFYFYFAEIGDLQDGQHRQMTIQLNNGNPTYVTLSQYLLQKTIGPMTTSGSELQFVIKTAGELQHLPPILNAFEIFRLHKLPNQATASEEIAAMLDIKQIFAVTRISWQGDPCVPSDFSWEGVNCDGKNPPKIISLNLSSSNLKGELPASLSNLASIQSLDLSYNELSGQLPNFLAELPNLKILDLSGNNFSGSVPRALKEKFKDSPMMLSLGGNPNLCQSNSCSKKNKFLVPVVASTVLLLFIAIISSAFAILWINKRQNSQKREISNKEGVMKSNNRLFSYAEVENITDNFKTEIGGGGFGNVYYGVLADGTQVAVKLLSKSSNQGNKEFQAEAQLLMVVHHRNLVSLVGYCDEGEHKGLIYEYMANGNLQQQLSVRNGNILKWRERLQVAISSAQGLEYLHYGCKPPIIHRDLKPANILLDANMQAKIGDFGVSKIFSAENGSYMETIPVGTLGYLDPEYQACGVLHKKSDVYSFGIILLELITGRRAIIRGSGDNIHILVWIKPLVERGDIGNIVDSRLHGEFSNNSAWKAVEIAMSCVTPTAIQRPDMNRVLAELKEALDIELRHEKSRNVENKKMRSTYGLVEMASVQLGEDMTLPSAR